MGDGQPPHRTPGLTRLAKLSRQKRGSGNLQPWALGLAFLWQSLLEAGKFDSISAIAAAEGMSKGRVSRIMQLCRLSPERVQGLMETPGSARLKTVLRLDIPLSWEL